MRLGKTGLVLCVVAGGFWTATHGVAHVAWSDVVTILRHVAPEQLILLTVIWLAGLAVYSLVLSAALPGLGVPRSLLLNLSGSAVSNVLPLGGAAGTALNWRMVTRWGHSSAAFAAFCVLTNALDVLTKLALPLVAVAGLALVSAHVPTSLWVMAACCATVLLASTVVEPVVRRISHGTRSRHRVIERTREQVRDSWQRIRELLRVGAPRLLIASAGYIAAQVALLDVSLHTVGLQPPLTIVLMAAAIERLGSLIPITPAGAGVAEVGAIAWLVGAGLAPVEVVAGVLLCRVFLVVLEIPLGSVLLAGWLWSQRSAHAATGSEVPA
ncbi:YbhN family protein [Marmoricola sp. URHB0036]|uniref:lysylphosphatidylglycerol synthase transmembrane domain-containing protein n=1 Tax=Marmoricola sp. URHB0036 TaxID=1298863 RepID=UPI00040BA1A0|nr:YbhN family protein [Marmoricola sp. URHB0036]